MADPSFHDIVILNGKTWRKDEFLYFIQEELDHHKPESWLGGLYSFYAEWFGSGDEITIQTSGSTGPIKTIHFKKSQLIASAYQTGDYFQLDKMSNCLLCLPVDFIAGKMMVVRALVYGLDLLAIKPNSDPLANLEQTVDFAAMTPHQVYRSLENIRDFSKIQTLIIGGGQISRELIEKLQTQPTACFCTYGMAETLTHIAVKRINGHNRQSHFQCLPGIKIRSDERGCLIVSADYLTEEIVTNDVVELISEKEFDWLGRFDNLINSGGIKIFPELLEEEISNLIPGNFFISSIPDPALGEKVILVIEKEMPTKQEKSTLIENLKKSLPGYSCPKEVFYLDGFEYTGSGKINRKKTLQMFINMVS